MQLTLKKIFVYIVYIIYNNRHIMSERDL